MNTLAEDDRDIDNDNVDNDINRNSCEERLTQIQEAVLKSKVINCYIN